MQRIDHAARCGFGGGRVALSSESRRRRAASSAGQCTRRVSRISRALAARIRRARADCSVCRLGTWLIHGPRFTIANSARNRFVQIQNGPRHHGHRRQLGRVQSAGTALRPLRAVARRRTRRDSKLVEAVADKDPTRMRRSSSSGARFRRFRKGPVQLAVTAGAAGSQNIRARTRAPLRRRSDRSADPAPAAACWNSRDSRCTPRAWARRRSAALGCRKVRCHCGIERAAVQIVAVAGGVFALGEIQRRQIAVGLIGRTLGPPNFSTSRPETDERDIVHDFGIHAKTALPREQAIVGIALVELRA